VNGPVTQAFLEDTVLFLQVLDDAQLMAVNPTSEHHEQQL